MKKRVRLIYLVFLNMLLLFSGYFSTINNVQAFESTQTMEFGDIYYVWHNSPLGEDKDIVWSFSGSREDIGIKVGIMDQDTRNHFSYMLEADYWVSDGSNYEDSGRFHIPYEDTWYLVFMVTDLEGLFYSTTVNIKVEFVDEMNLALILGLSIGIPSGLIIIAFVLVLFLVILPKRIAKINRETPKIQGDEIFCWKCGSKNPVNQIYCGNCGAKLAKE